jgi:nucleotide-binding universal stress UspA family protein
MAGRQPDEVTVEERPGVVVGIDGSSASLAAFAYGAWEADRRGSHLYLVHCHAMAGPFAPLGLMPDPGVAEGQSAAASERLADLAEQARAIYPRLSVQTAVVAGSPGATLVRASHHATLVVVGSRGLGGFAGLLLGSVSAQLAAHSAAPVVVIRTPAGRGSADSDRAGGAGEDQVGAAELGAPPAPGPVVVGVDGVPDSEAAIAFAFDQAAARGVPVVAVYAWWLLPVSGLQPPTSRPVDLLEEPDLRRAEEEARRMLAEATAGAREEYPDVAVSLMPAHELNPVVALLEASAEAGLLVVSRHGGNALTRLIFSSVGDIAVREASCPVAVVPETSTRDRRGDAATTVPTATTSRRRSGGRSRR